MARVITAALLEAAQRGFKTNFQIGFDGHKALLNSVATVVTSTAAVEDYGWLNTIPKLREWIGDRHVHGLGTKQYTIRNRKFELTIGVLRDDIEDDKLGLYSNRFQMMGQSAASHPDEIVFELINSAFAANCYDGQYFFDTDHPVGKEGNVASVSNMQSGSSEKWILADLSKPLKPFIFQKRRDYEFTSLDNPNATESVFMRDEYKYGINARVAAGFGFWQMAFGSKATLDATNLRAAYTAMTKFADDEGRPLGIRPTHLIVGPNNQFTARDILLSEQISGSTNTNRNLVSLIEAPLLT
ncbi:MAG: Mu-like prophage major head subunit gpT family protein [Rhizobiaceae bacterium]|nr:Mu-like prophage major head subunit gpT family protein [Rhizobiaceae bacterium]